MRKKIAIFAAMIFGVAATTAAIFTITDDERVIGFDSLPTEAQSFVKTHFAEEQVSHVVEDIELIGNEYKVVFASGTKVEFDNSGNWTEVDCHHTAVPAAIVPAAIADYVKSNYASSSITELKREHGMWEAKITGGLELTFNKDMRLVDIDD